MNIAFVVLFLVLAEGCNDFVRLKYTRNNIEHLRNEKVLIKIKVQIILYLKLERNR